MTIERYGVLAFIAGLLASLFWMVVAWRAMRAHEKIAAALSGDDRYRRRSPLDAGVPESTKADVSFREFLQADPLAKYVDATEQMRRYAEWKQQRSGD